MIMATPAEKLAESLIELEKLQNEKGIAVIKADDLTRTHKERLIVNGFIREVIKGWYISCTSDEKQGETTSWYLSFWNFIALYIDTRFGKDWCLSPEQSLSLHSGNFMVPGQLLIRSPKASNNKVNLLHDSSIFDSKVEIPPHNARNEIEGVQVYSFEAGFVAVSSDFYTRHPTDARICLAMVKDSSGVLAKLLDGGKSLVAGRLSGAFRNIGNDKIANSIMDTMKSAGYDVRETDPFDEKIDFEPSSREVSPYVNRIKIMWKQMRNEVIKYFPDTPKEVLKVDDYLKHVKENYRSDAYHSLSIEGYRVTPELIEKVAGGDWDPNRSVEDRQQKDAMAARGYFQAFQVVMDSIRSVLEHSNPGEVVDNDHGSWYRELFAPSVAVGLVKASDLAGYRNGPVYINGSMHAPPDMKRFGIHCLFFLIC
ncbi:MAG: cell filamentation protein Fic [Bacteroidales bacterium]|nr:cell filamentation protein Fic [Bacteroidales bacterium]